MPESVILAVAGPDESRFDKEVGKEIIDNYCFETYLTIDDRPEIQDVFIKPLSEIMMETSGGHLHWAMMALSSLHISRMIKRPQSLSKAFQKLAERYAQQGALEARHSFKKNDFDYDAMYLYWFFSHLYHMAEGPMYDERCMMRHSRAMFKILPELNPALKKMERPKRSKLPALFEPAEEVQGKLSTQDEEWLKSIQKLIGRPSRDWTSLAARESMVQNFVQKQKDIHIDADATRKRSQDAMHQELNRVRSMMLSRAGGRRSCSPHEFMTWTHNQTSNFSSMSNSSLPAYMILEVADCLLLHDLSSNWMFPARWVTHVLDQKWVFVKDEHDALWQKYRAETGWIPGDKCTIHVDKGPHHSAYLSDSSSDSD